MIAARRGYAPLPFGLNESRLPRRSRTRTRRLAGEDRAPRAGKILLLGRIRELALYRGEYLRAKGYDVTSPADHAQAVEAIRRGGFQLAVVTYTLSNETVLEFAEMLRQYCPSCPLIVIANSTRADRNVAPDEIVLADDGPEALLAAIQRVLAKRN